MKINFLELEFANEDALRQILEKHFIVGTTTVEDVLLFAKENNLECYGPTKQAPNMSGRAQKHEIHVTCRKEMPPFRWFFKSSNLKVILKSLFRLWTLLLVGYVWIMKFYFDDNVLTEMITTLGIIAP